MMKRIGFVAMLLIVVSGWTGQTHAQSFGCGYARHADEVTICGNTILSALDERMSSLYQQRLSYADTYEKSAIRRSQMRWLASRRNCGYSVSCIRSHYLNRIAQLQY